MQSIKAHFPQVEPECAWQRESQTHHMDLHIQGPWLRPRCDFKGDPLIFCGSFWMCERISRQPQHIWDGVSSGNHYKAQTCPGDFLHFLPDVGTACSSSLGCSCSSTRQLHTGETQQVSPHPELPFFPPALLNNLFVPRFQHSNSPAGIL